MKKSIIANSIAAVLLTSALPAFAEDNKIVVTANRMQQNINDTLANIEIIDRAEIEQLQAQSLADLLVNVAGVDFVRSGGHAQSQSVFIRGSNADQTLVLVDGIRVGSATLGSKAIAGIPMAQVERIEIIKGPRAAVWGSDAIGGVIQIFTRKYQSGEHRLALTLGSNSTKEIDLAAGFGNETVSNTLSYSRKESDGFDVRLDNEDDDDGYENESVALRGEYNISDNNKLNWVAQSDRGFAMFDSAFSQPVDNVNNYKNHQWNIGYQHQGDSFSHDIKIGAVRDLSKSGTNNFETRRQQINYLVVGDISDALSLSGGLEFYSDNIERTSTTYAETERDTKSVFVNLNYTGNKILTELAVRQDDVEKVANETSLMAAFGYRFSDNHLLGVNYAEGFKAPTFNDLYFPFGGNPDLEFETSENVELTYKGNFANSVLNIAYFDSDVENLIEWAPNTSGGWSPQNVGQAELSGFELSYQFNHDDFSHTITADSIKAINANTGDRLIRRAKNHFGYELGYASGAFEFLAQVQYVGKRPDRDYQTFTTTELDSFTRVNLSVGYLPNENWKIQLKVNDAFDEAPTEISGYRPVEQEFYLTFSYQNIK